MNKSELIEKIADKAGMSKRSAEAALDAILDSITGAMTAGDKVQLTGFGVFEAKARAARTGRNPKTGEVLEIQAHRTPTFKASKSLKDTMK